MPIVVVGLMCCAAGAGLGYWLGQRDSAGAFDRGSRFGWNLAVEKLQRFYPKNPIGVIEEDEPLGV